MCSCGQHAGTSHPGGLWVGGHVLRPHIFGALLALFHSSLECNKETNVWCLSSSCHIGDPILVMFEPTEDSISFSTCEESLPTTPGTIFGGRSSGSTVYLPHHAPATGSMQTEKYGALEKLLLRSHSLSAAERANKLLSLPSLGDESAVEGGFLFLHIFLRQLPPRFAQPWSTLHV